MLKEMRGADRRVTLSSLDDVLAMHKVARAFGRIAFCLTSKQASKQTRFQKARNA